MGIETAIGLGLAAAGTAMGMKAAQDSKSAMNRTVVNQLRQNREFQEKATPAYAESLRKSSRQVADAAIQKGERTAQTEYSQLMPRTSANLPIDQNRLAGQLGQARGAAATMRGYGNFELEQWLKNQLASTRIGIYSNLAQSAAMTTPALLSLAGQSGADLAAWGSLMSTAGNLAGIYGGIKRGGSGGSLTAKPARVEPPYLKGY